MYPIGDAEVVVGFKGKGLPEPETIFNVNRVRITFKEVRLDASDMTDRSVTVPGNYKRNFSESHSKYCRNEIQKRGNRRIYAEIGGKY